MRKYEVLENSWWKGIDVGDVLIVDNEDVICPSGKKYSTREDSCKSDYIAAMFDDKFIVREIINTAKDTFFIDANAHAQTRS